MLDFPLSWKFWVLISFLPFFYWYFTRNFNFFIKRGISGPKPIFLFGNTIEEFTTNKIVCEEKWANQYGKVYGSFRGQTPVLTIADPNLIKQVLVKDFNKFTDRPGFGNVEHKILDLNLGQVNGNEWRRIRSLVTPTFTSSKMKKILPLVKTSLEVLLNAIEKQTNGNGEVEVKNIFGAFTMEVIGSCAFATNTNTLVNPDHPFLVNAKKLFNVKILKALAAFLLPVSINKRLGITSFFDNDSLEYLIKLLRQIIKERQNNKDNYEYHDFLQLIINAEKTDENYRDEEDKFDAHHVNEGEEEIAAEKNVLFSNQTAKKLTEDEIIAQGVVFFIAGYEATATTLSWAAYELALNPSIQQRLYEEIKTAVDTNGDIDYDLLSKLPFLDAVISETLRLHNPAVKLNRICTEKCHLDDTDITMEEGQQVEIAVHVVHHTEQFHREPYMFNPNRFMPENRHMIIPYSYLPFGGGPRNCIGMRFGLMEAKIALACIIKHYKLMRTDNTAVPPDVGTFMVINSPKTLVLGFEKR